MKAFVRRSLLALASATTPRLPLALYTRILPRAPIGFFYHVISDDPLPHIRHLYPFKSTAEFELDLQWLKQHTQLVDYNALATHASTGQPLPANAAYISFDDGFRECYETVQPLLLKHNVPGLFFLTTSWLDNQDLFFRSRISLALNALANLLPEERKRALQTFKNPI